MTKPSGRPTGTVTYLFTGVVAPTGEPIYAHGAMDAAIARQEAIVRAAVEAEGGYTYKAVGGALQAAFATAPQAALAAIVAQKALGDEPWPQAAGELRVRMALHTGVTQESEGDYSGPVLNRIARLLAAGHGGQVLLTGTTAQLLEGLLSEPVALKDLGEHHLKDLTRPEHIYQLVAPDLPTDFPPLDTLDSRPNNLPAQPTPLVGREKELDEIQALLMQPDVRVLTLTGAGGIGKTRLVLQAAAELLERFTDGVFFVNLAPFTDPALLVRSIAEELGVSEEGGQPLFSTLKDYLREKQTLLVLDNMEQILEAAPRISELIAAAPDLKVLVTSRASLNLYIEHEYPVPPLSLPPASHITFESREALSRYEAVALFVTRARAAMPGFELTDTNARVIAEICIRLDGLPLAIELAAARTKVLSPDEVLTRLGRSLKLLTGGLRDLPARQQTLRATVQWSYELLDSGEKQLFHRLAVLAGGYTMEDVEMVCNANGDLELDVLDGIESLVSKSLLRPEESATGASRFHMLQTIHEYARERLEESGESEQLELLHSEHFLGFAEKAEQEIVGPDHASWMQQLDESQENLLAALDRSCRKEGADYATIALRLSGALWRYWWIRGYLSEGRQWLELALRQADRYAEDSAKGTDDEVPAQARAKALNGLGNLAYSQGDYPAARGFHDEALLIRHDLGNLQDIAGSLNNLGNTAVEQGDYQAARSYLEQAVAILRELGSKRWTAVTLGNLAAVIREQGEYDKARALFEESMSIQQELGDTAAMSNALTGLGHISMEQGDYAKARSYMQASLEIDRAEGHRPEIAMALHNLANVAQDEGDYDTAISLFQQSLAMKRELGDKRGIGSTLLNLAAIAFEQGDYAQARALTEESLDVRQQTGGKRGIAMCLLYLGKLAAVEGDYPQALSYYLQSTDIRMEILDRYGIAQCLAEFAVLASRQEQWKRAVMLFAAADALLSWMGARLPANQRPAYDRALAGLREHLEPAEFEDAWAKGSAMTMEQAIDYARGEEAGVA